MADGGLRLVHVAAYPHQPSHHSSPYHYLSPLSDSPLDSHRGPSSTSLSPYDQLGTNMATSSLSPPNIKDEFGGVGTGIAYGGPSPPPATAATPTNDKAAPLGLNFLKSLSDKKLTRDGQPAKRRGPKPDSKPALTRRQELNRQAQR